MLSVACFICYVQRAGCIQQRIWRRSSGGRRVRFTQCCYHVPVSEDVWKWHRWMFIWHCGRNTAETISERQLFQWRGRTGRLNIYCCIVCKYCIYISVLRHHWLGNRKCIQPVKNPLRQSPKVLLCGTCLIWSNYAEVAWLNKNKRCSSNTRSIWAFHELESNGYSALPSQLHLIALRLRSAADTHTEMPTDTIPSPA